jgi:hypothetical protein
MRQQIEAIGGTFSAANGEERGFVVRVSVPLRDHEAGDGSGDEGDEGDESTVPDAGPIGRHR